jgi:hypothetical protein
LVPAPIPIPDRVKETVMLRGFEASLESRLREAEAAEKEVLRLQQVA